MCIGVTHPAELVAECWTADPHTDPVTGGSGQASGPPQSPATERTDRPLQHSAASNDTHFWQVTHTHCGWWHVTHKLRDTEWVTFTPTHTHTQLTHLTTDPHLLTHSYSLTHGVNHQTALSIEHTPTHTGTWKLTWTYFLFEDYRN